VILSRPTALRLRALRPPLPPQFEYLPSVPWRPFIPQAFRSNPTADTRCPVPPVSVLPTPSLTCLMSVEEGEERPSSSSSSSPSPPVVVGSFVPPVIPAKVRESLRENVVENVVLAGPPGFARFDSADYYLDGDKYKHGALQAEEEGGDVTQSSPATAGQKAIANYLLKRGTNNAQRPAHVWHG
jgi:hypothetical protein